VNNIHMRGSVLVFRNFTLLWNVQRAVDISPRNLAAVHIIKPHPEILVLGTGDSIVNVNPVLYPYLARKGVSLEVMSTPNAIATFNTLNSENRRVAAALLSRVPMPRDEACLYTPDAVESPADRALKRLLSRGGGAAAANDPRLLEGAAEAPPEAAASAAAASAARTSSSRRAALEAASRDIGRTYGYPTANLADAPIEQVADAALPSEADAPATRTKPRSVEEYMDSRARRGQRRSAAARNADDDGRR